MNTEMTANPRLLSATLSTKIGGETAEALAVVAVGGMTATLFLDRYLMRVHDRFHGHHRQPPDGGAGTTH